MPKISIVIPTYNVENYLEEAMESITRQTLKDIEIICINDGSTDGSLEILKKYARKDDRIILIDKKNEGYGIGMNLGLETASGEYFGILEPDDYVPLNMYEDLYNAASAQKLDFVKADFYQFTKDDKTGDMNLKYCRLSDNPSDYNRVFNPGQTPEAIKFKMHTWSGIYRTEFLRKNHIRYNTTPGASFQDNGFFFQTFVFAEKAMLIDRPYYRNRRDNPNSSVHNPEKVYCANIEYDYIREILFEHHAIWKKFQAVYWWKKYNSYAFTLRRIGDEYKRDYVHQMAKEFQRAQQLGELKESVFDSSQWSDVKFLIHDPDGYYYRKVFGNKVPESGGTAGTTRSGTGRLRSLIRRALRKIKRSLKSK